MSPPRGQATVELALGLLLAVTIIVVGIHFAEVGFLSVRLQEASHAALFDTTGARMHVTSDDGTRKYDPMEAAIASAGPIHQQMYEDLDGRSSKDNGTTVTQVFTQASDVRVLCTNEPAINFNAKASFANICDNPIGGIKCQARATLRGYRLPEAFLDSGSGGFFNVAHYVQPPWVVCADGRVAAGEGKCRGFVSMLLDDWAFSSPNEAGECKVEEGAGCANKPYYQVVKRLFDQYGRARGSAGSNLARGMTGASPYDENRYWMSFEGEDSPFGPFREHENGGDRDPNDWVTTPGAGSPVSEYDASYSARSSCWLGLPCQ